MVETTSFIDVITNINLIIGTEKITTNKKQALYEALGKIGAIVNSLQQENTRFKAENKVYKEMKPQNITYAQKAQTETPKISISKSIER